jgi:hypothetical protein
MEFVHLASGCQKLNSQMNHFTLGIIKIILLEAAIGLLIIELIAKDSFKSFQSKASALIAMLMTLAWTNFGSGRGGVSMEYVWLGIPVILVSAWLLRNSINQEVFSARGKQFNEFMSARFGQRATLAGAVLALTVFTAWAGFGISNSKLRYVHTWEQFHFFMGAKYQNEIGSFNIYKATLLADRESTHMLGNIATVRDLTNFEEIPVAQALQNEAEVKARFTPERWAAFKDDWIKMSQQWPMDWGRAVMDHGNSNSPAWVLVAAPLTYLFPISPANTAILGFLDLALLFALFMAIWQVFGHRVASISLVVTCAQPFVFDYLVGSFLRWDWLFCLGIAACFLHKEKYKWAGGFFGFAVATKLFPLFFGISMLLKVANDYRVTKKIEKRHIEFASAAAGIGAVSVMLSSLFFGFHTWVEYAQRIQVAQVEKFYTIQYSLKTVFLQFVASDFNTLSQTFFPSQLAQALPNIDIKDYSIGFMLARLLFTGIIFILVKRATDVEAFLMGPFLVFTWLTVNMYYWNMLGLLTLGLMLRLTRHQSARGMLIAIMCMNMFFYFHQHLNRALTEGFIGSLSLTLILIVTGFIEWRAQRSPNPNGEPPEIQAVQSS